MKRLLPNETDQRFLIFAATGTDLIFNRFVELPGFATFPLVEDPQELGAQVAQPVRSFPHISIVGGCCGSDLRHMREMAVRVSN